MPPERPTRSWCLASPAQPGRSHPASALPAPMRSSPGATASSPPDDHRMTGSGRQRGFPGSRLREDRDPSFGFPAVARPRAEGGRGDRCAVGSSPRDGPATARRVMAGAGSRRVAVKDSDRRPRVTRPVRQCRDPSPGPDGSSRVRSQGGPRRRGPGCGSPVGVPSPGGNAERQVPASAGRRPSSATSEADSGRATWPWSRRWSGTDPSASAT